MWNVIPYGDFRNLVLNYDEMDFSKFQVSVFRRPDGRNVVRAVFDSIVGVYYIHYHQDVRYKSPVKIDIDVYADDIVSYVSDAIHRRVGRMFERHEKPVFLFETRSRNSNYSVYTESDIMDFMKLDTDYKKILLVNQPQFGVFSSSDGRCDVLNYRDVEGVSVDTTHMASVVYDRFRNLFGS